MNAKQMKHKNQYQNGLTRPQKKANVKANQQRRRMTKAVQILENRIKKRVKITKINDETQGEQ